MSNRVHGTKSNGGWHPGLKGTKEKSVLRIKLGELAQEGAFDEGDEDEEEDDEEDEEAFGPRLPVFDGTKHVGGLHGLQWCRRTGRLASGCKDGSAALWGDRASVGVLLDGHNDDDEEHGAWIRAVGFSTDGKVLATGGMQGRVAVWDAEDGELLMKVRLASATALAERHAEVEEEAYYVLALSWVKSQILAIAGASREVALWKVDYGGRYKTARLARGGTRVIRRH